MGLSPKQQHRPDGRHGWDPVAALRSQIREAHQLIDEQVSVTLQRTRLMPGADGDVLSIYVHTVCVEDATVHVLLREMRPLFQRVWVTGNLLPWDLTSIQGYAAMVYAATDVLLAHLTAADLQSSIDLCDAGLGRQDVGWVLNRFIVWETARSCGELSRLAGSRESRGYQAEPSAGVSWRSTTLLSAT